MADVLEYLMPTEPRPGRFPGCRLEARRAVMLDLDETS
jgi:hypothetical protein